MMCGEVEEMHTLLHIDSSPMGEASVSRQLTREFVEQWKAANPGGRTIRRDLAAVSIPRVSPEWVKAVYTPEDMRTGQQGDLLRLSAEFARELLEADEYVIGVPVHNWGPCASFKLWVDHMVTPFGPKLDGKCATFIVSAGRCYGWHAEDPAKNHVTPWLKTLFSGLGIAEMRFVFADCARDVIQGKKDLASYLAPHLQSIERLFASEAAG
jgi:FMN-dependent NADH-azoreductase